MDSLAEFLRAKRFPYEVRKRVRTFYAHLYENKTVFDEKEVSTQATYQVLLAFRVRVLARVPLPVSDLRGFD